MADNIIDQDADLISRSAQGDESAFEQLVKKYEHAVFNTVYRYAGNQDDAADLCQEIFLKVWRNAGKFRGKSKFSTWLDRIAVNHCIDYQRKAKQKHVSLDELIEKEVVPGSLTVNPDPGQAKKIEMVRRAVALLPGRQRMALTLAQYDGYSYKEIAKIMKISVSSVESLIFRARSTLRELFRQWQAAGNPGGPGKRAGHQLRVGPGAQDR